LAPLIGSAREAFVSYVLITELASFSMRFVDRFFDYFMQTSDSLSGPQWISTLAGLSLITYVLIIFGGRGR
jgi:hypothetical protein